MHSFERMRSYGRYGAANAAAPSGTGAHHEHTVVVGTHTKGGKTRRVVVTVYHW
jgi:hypothetical protein